MLNVAAKTAENLNSEGKFQDLTLEEAMNLVREELRKDAEKLGLIIGPSLIVSPGQFRVFEPAGVTEQVEGAYSQWNVGDLSKGFQSNDKPGSHMGTCNHHGGISHPYFVVGVNLDGGIEL